MWRASSSALFCSLPCSSQLCGYPSRTPSKEKNFSKNSSPKLLLHCTAKLAKLEGKTSWRASAGGLPPTERAHRKTPRTSKISGESTLLLEMYRKLMLQFLEAKWWGEGGRGSECGGYTYCDTPACRLLGRSLESPEMWGSQPERLHGSHWQWQLLLQREEAFGPWRFCRRWCVLAERLCCQDNWSSSFSLNVLTPPCLQDEARS